MAMQRRSVEVKTIHEFEHSGVTPSVPAGGRARLYPIIDRPDRINISVLSNPTDRASRCFHLWQQRILFPTQITGANAKVRPTDRSPSVMRR
jgi:hypothetical protein